MAIEGAAPSRSRVGLRAGDGDGGSGGGRGGGGRGVGMRWMGSRGRGRRVTTGDVDVFGRWGGH